MWRAFRRAMALGERQNAIIRVRFGMLDQNPCSALFTSASPATLHQACLSTFSGLLLLPQRGLDRAPKLLLHHHQPPHPSLPLPRSTKTGTPSKQARKRRITHDLLAHQAHPRQPGHQGMCRVVARAGQ